MISRHKSAKISASFHCMLDVFCRTYLLQWVCQFVLQVSFDVGYHMVVGPVGAW